MKPYYQDDLVTLYHGDCRDDVDRWRYSADILVTDPPYGIGWTKGLNKAAASRAHAGIANDGDTTIRDWMIDKWGKDRPAIVFGSLYRGAPHYLRHVLVWAKPSDAGVIGSTTGYRRDIDAVYLCGLWPQRSPAWSSVVRSGIPSVGNPFSPAGRTGHPHAKPVDLMCLLMQRAPDGKVADPFAGSGTTLVAAKSLGRNAVGVEIDERYCEIAANRLRQEVLDLGGAA